MSLHIGVLGTGGVGGYVGGRLALSGEDVTLISQRRENVEYIRSRGLRLTDTRGEQLLRPTVFHVSELEKLVVRPFDVVLLCVKSYDTAPMCAVIAPYVAPDGCIVSMQNGMNEEDIARAVGRERTMGVVMSSIGVNAVALGHVMRTSTPGGDSYTVFRVGRPDGTLKTRVEEVVRALSAVDSAVATTNLFGERWSKLVTNSISHGLSAVTGLASLELLTADSLRPLIIAMAAEGVRAGQCLGYSLVAIYGASPEAWRAAADGDRNSSAEINRQLAERLLRLTVQERPSVAQDLMRGRRTELEYTNGLLVAKAERLRLAVPIQKAVLGLARRIERGEIAPDPWIVSSIMSPGRTGT